MPIALLLQEALAPLTAAGPLLERWQAMLRLEALVVARARGAFLVHWFGPGLAASGGRLLVGIQNVEALALQYRRARAASVAGDTGPNLLEPLASLAGMGAGMILSPSGAVLTLFAILRREICRVGALLLTITHSAPMMQLMTAGGAGLLIGLGLPLFLLGGIGYALYVALSDDDVVQQHELLGDVARMIRSLTRFIDLLTGPREAIRNPLLASLLGLADAVAALMAQVIGAVAIALTRWLPLVAPNLRQFAALRDLSVAAIDLVVAILTDAWRTLEQLYTSEEGRRASPWQVLQDLFAHAERLAARMAEGARVSLTGLGRLLGERLAALTSSTEAYLGDVGSRARSIIADMPLARTLRAVVAMVAAVRTITGAIPAPPAAPAAPSATSGAASQLAGAAAALVPALVEAHVGPRPPAPSVAVAGVIVTLTRMGFEVAGRWGPGITGAEAAPFVLDPATQTGVAELLRAPASVFGGERAAVQRELGDRTPAQALAAMRAEDLRYRDLLVAVVARVLPPHLQAYLPTLRDTFDAIDQHVYGQPEAGPREEFPVREVPDNGRLRPLVRRLVLRQPGGDEVSLQGMATDLQRLLREQVYLAPLVA